MIKINSAAPIIALGIVITGFDIVSTIRHERAKRIEIGQKAAAQLTAIHNAQAEIREMINEGLYDGKDLQGMLNDFKDLVNLETEI